MGYNRVHTNLAGVRERDFSHTNNVLCGAYTVVSLAFPC
jgi:hypothetical protein